VDKDFEHGIYHRRGPCSSSNHSNDVIVYEHLPCLFPCSLYTVPPPSLSYIIAHIIFCVYCDRLVRVLLPLISSIHHFEFRIHNAQSTSSVARQLGREAHFVVYARVSLYDRSHVPVSVTPRACISFGFLHSGCVCVHAIPFLSVSRPMRCFSTIMRCHSFFWVSL